MRNFPIGFKTKSYLKCTSYQFNHYLVKRAAHSLRVKKLDNKKTYLMMIQDKSQYTRKQ